MEEKRLVLAQDNVITKARYKFDVIEKRCIYQIIYSVRKNFVENENGQRNLFDNLIIRLKPKDLDECANGRDNRTKVYKSLKSLNKKQLEFENTDEWFVCNFINYAKHNKKLQEYEIEVSKMILPYLVSLAENFTTLDLTVALTFGSRYTQRFYEFCCMYRNRGTNYFFLELEELRRIMALDNKYARFYNFKVKVLDVAQREMQQSYDEGIADIYFTWKENEKIEGRLDFYLHQKKDETSIDYTATTLAINSISNILESFFPRDKKFIKRVKTAMQINPNVVSEIQAKLTKKVNDYPRKDIPPILRYVLKEDFGIE